MLSRHKKLRRAAARNRWLYGDLYPGSYAEAKDNLALKLADVVCEIQDAILDAPLLRWLRK